MADTRDAWEPTGLERFGHLEDRIYRFVEAFKAVRKENQTLREDNQRLKAELESQCAQESSRQQHMAQLQSEREELRDRVEKALSLLAALEDR
ncbi:MAG: cell division protein ZapB [Acidobacteria bacterium]|nr:cell division protein ZapB [Acidobacteriota bacterium]